MRAGLRDNLDFSIDDTRTKYNKESRPSFQANFYSEEKAVEKAWQDFISKKCDCDFKKEKGFYQAVGIRLPEITAETITLISVTEKTNDGASLDVMIDYGGRFMGEGGDKGEVQALKSMMTAFMKEFYVGWYEEVISDEEKEHGKLNKDYEKSVKAGEKLAKNIEGKHSDINKAEENILKAEQEILNLQHKMEELKVQIENDKKEIENLEQEVISNTKVIEEKKAIADEKAKDVEKLKASSANVK